MCESKTHFHNVFVLWLYYAIFVCIRTCDSMIEAMLNKIYSQTLELAFTISLNRLQHITELSLNIVMKLNEDSVWTTLLLQEINPCILSSNVNNCHIVFVTIWWKWRRAPKININHFQSFNLCRSGLSKMMSTTLPNQTKHTCSNCRRCRYIS